MVVRPITSLKRIESSKIIIIKGVTYATCHQKYQFRAAPLALSMWPCKRKLDDKKSKHAGFAQQMVLAYHFCTWCCRWERTQQSLTPAVDPDVDLLDRLIDSGVLLLVVSHLFAVPVLVLWVRLGKRAYLNLDVKNHFCKVTYWAPLGILIVQLLHTRSCCP